MNLAFKRGVYHLNDQSNFDFQLNRIVMWDGGDLEEIQKIGSEIKTSEDWKRELIALGNRAVSEGRTENAIAYYRMSEFFMYDGDPDKKKYYKMATEMFYEFHKDVFASGEVERFEAPRAAAFEKRISRVIAWSVMPNFPDVVLNSGMGGNERLTKIAGWLISHKCRTIVNLIFHKKAKKDELVRWGTGTREVCV